MPDGFGEGGFGEGGFGATNEVARASYNGYASWAAYNVGLFTIGNSTLSGTDVFGVSPFDASFGGAYDDISTRLADFTVSRGRNNNLDTVLQGNASIDLRDPAGTFNPDNPSGPLYGQLEDRLHPVKLTDTYAGVTRGLFYGWVRRFHWEPQGRRGVTRLECVDLFYWLERANPVLASAGATTTGAAIGRVLDAVGATDPAMRDLDIGDTIPDFAADGTQTALQLIGGLLDAERGVFFISGAGKATYRSRLSRLLKTSQYTFVDVMAHAEPGVDWDQAYDRITVKRSQNGYTAIAYDSIVVAKNGYNDMPAIETAYLGSDGQADQLAEWVLAQNISPRPPMHDFTIDNRDANLLTQLLARELVDRITVSAARGGTSGDYHIDQISHQIDGATGRHTTAWLLSKAGPVASPFLIGSSTIDSTDVLVYSA